MNYKSIHIKYRFFLQILFFIVYLFALTLTIWLISKRFSAYQDTTLKINYLEKGITELQTTYLSFLHKTQPNDRFFIEGENDYTSLFKMQANAIKDSLKNLSDKKGILKKIEKNGFRDSLISSLNTYIIDFDQTTITLRELGMQNSGKIFSLRNLSDEILRSSDQFHHPELAQTLSLLKTFESEYLLTGNRTAFDTINYFVDELTYLFPLAVTDSIYIQDLLDRLDTYKTNLQQVNTVIQIINMVAASSDRDRNPINYQRTITSYRRFSNTSADLSQSVLQLYQPELYHLISRLKTIESEYLIARKTTAYNDIIGLIDRITFHPALSSLDSLQEQTLSAQLKAYKNSLENIKTIIERIGTVDETDGLYGKLDHSYQATLAKFGKFRNHWITEKKKGEQVVLTLGIAVIFIISLVYIYLFLLFFRSFHRPLKQSIEYSYRIAKGKLSSRSLNVDGPADFAKLNTNLNSINESLVEKKKFVDDLLKQKFQADVSLQGRSDTFGKTLIALKENMRKARDEQLKYHEENRVRRYLNEGIAKFSDILRSHSDNLDRLADIFIKEIVRYLEAVQGGLFLLDNEEDEILHLKAAFAYDRKKYLTKEIRKGESLVGTCALEKKTIRLNQIPDDYIEITSGLGDAPPNNLLILPVMHEGVLIGVLEIASLKEFDENQIHLGESISESLASSIINARANSRTAELLEKSQQQAAEMAEQEEEMRQNMEELKATQEESARREEDLQGILNAIDQSFYVIEYEIDGTITKVNERLLYLLNKHADKVIGKTHAQVFGKKSKADSLLFANVAEGKTVELIEKVEINKKLLEIKNTFSPVRSKDGSSMRILNIMNLNT